MERKEININITVNKEKEPALFNIIQGINKDFDNKCLEYAFKNALEVTETIASTFSNEMGFTYPSALNNELKDKSKEELSKIKQTYIDDILNRIDELSIAIDLESIGYHERDGFIFVDEKSELAYLYLLSQYIKAINELTK